LWRSGGYWKSAIRSASEGGGENPGIDLGVVAFVQDGGGRTREQEKKEVSAMTKLAVLTATGVMLGVLAMSAVWAAETTTKPAKAFVNAKCPGCGMTVDPAKVADDAARDYKHLKVGFCSTSCAGAWDKLSDADKDAKLKAVLAPVVNGKCPITGRAFDRKAAPLNLVRMFDGKVVGFCCPGCPGAWDKLSDADKAAKLKAVMSD
jgi:hypothetical protein